MLKKLTDLFIDNTPAGFEDPAAFEVIYRDNQEFIRTNIYWMVRHQQVDDLVQETFKRAWAARKQFSGKSTVRTWLYRIAMNVTKDHLKEVGKRPLSEFNENEHQDQSSLEERASLKDSISLALETLSMEERELFILFYKLNLNQKEIATIKEVPVGTIKSRLHYARDKFMKAIEKQQVNYEQV